MRQGFKPLPDFGKKRVCWTRQEWGMPTYRENYTKERVKSAAMLSETTAIMSPL
jgi:protoporphyrinogen oxidase